MKNWHSRNASGLSFQSQLTISALKDKNCYCCKGVKFNSQCFKDMIILAPEDPK